jgi:hypothetical protein
MKTSRLRVRRLSRAARKAEVYIAEYRFPRHLEARVRRRFPEVDDAGWQLVEQGLREWFVCCAWRGRTMLGMPSRLVDEAWHEFLLDSVVYTRFCNAAFDGYLHHTPDEAMPVAIGDALGETVRAWDRSTMGSERESVLWDLDERLGIADPLLVSGVQLTAARSGAPHVPGGWACGGGIWISGSEGAGGSEGGEGGGACAGGGDGGGGGGCGGGGCGGGGGS